VARVPLPFKEFPLCPSDRTGNPSHQSVHAFEERTFGLARGVADRREVESTNRSRERVDMKISFEEATGVGDREEPDRSSISPEVIDGIPSDPNGPYDFGQQFDRGHVPSPLAVGVEDVRQAVEETNPVRGLLRVRVEDREAILRGNESLEAPQIRLGSAHNPGTSEAVLGITADTLLK